MDMARTMTNVIGNCSSLSSICTFAVLPAAGGMWSIAINCAYA